MEELSGRKIEIYRVEKLEIQGGGNLARQLRTARFSWRQVILAFTSLNLRTNVGGKQSKGAGGLVANFSTILVDDIENYIFFPLFSHFSTCSELDEYSLASSRKTLPLRPPSRLKAPYISSFSRSGISAEVGIIDTSKRGERGQSEPVVYRWSTT
ncbi:uncharacterized protein BDR25DRAFT_348972 [Lindgomyces ingoldianus]|uniref:Uncharacterized protein n=1 Tax=Lindgomyces ingoldianus TaxID=673940 RepID=A0ACB6RFH8_9PLEO|nr:uncharacterized protein BDR25DRAFT_348972 [Lindgomyces ingoldianus]KAF2477080.1 hypothetical protein BDR25DRAFT_348972 [Lindgomyces ingoldianus]